MRRFRFWKQISNLSFTTHQPTCLPSKIPTPIGRFTITFSHSIIVVDDFGERIPVPSSISRFSKVSLISNNKALGVAGARMAGAANVQSNLLSLSITQSIPINSIQKKQASGDVYVFLDSHMEVTKRWLEPLLEHVHEHPFGVAASIIDVLEQDRILSPGDISIVTLKYKTLDFKWYLSCTHLTHSPTHSPTHSLPTL